MAGILAAIFEFLKLLTSRINQGSNLITSTGAVLCALSFTAATILLQRLASESKPPGERWLEDFLAKTYSLAIDTGYHKTGTIVKRYIDEFVFHEFPNFGVDRYSGKLPQTRPNFYLGKYLSEELGSGLHVNLQPQPIQTSKYVDHTPPPLILWSKLPAHFRSLLWKIGPLKARILKRIHTRYERERYCTLSYALVPRELDAGSGLRTQFELGIAAEWTYSDIKRFEGKSSRIMHLALEVQYLVGWLLLLLRRLPAILSRPRDRLLRALLADAKRMRREDTQLRHATVEIRSLHERILYSRRPGNRIWPSFATVTFLFDAEESNHAMIFLYTTELQYLYEVRQFANRMLVGAMLFGFAAILGIISMLVTMIAVVSLFPYSLAWYILLQGLWKFRRYFIVSKEQENVGFVQPLRCPSCGQKIEAGSLVCLHCKATVSARTPPKPLTELIVSDKEPISEERWNRFVTAIRREYASMSRKTTAIPYRQAQPSDALEFKEFRQPLLVGPEILIDAYSAGDMYTSPEIIGVGRNIAFQEELYLVHRLVATIANRTSISSLSGQEIMNAIQHFQIKPTVAFCPIEYFTTLHMNAPHGMRIGYGKDGAYLEIGKMRMSIMWSTKYAPFKEFMFLESGLGEWVFKPDKESNRLIVDLSPERKNGKFVVTARTLAEFVLRDASKGLIVGIVSLQTSQEK